MLKNAKDPRELRSLLIAQFSTSGTLAGISLTLVGIINIRTSSTQIQTIADDMFVFSSMGFLIACYFIFFTLRHLESPRIQPLTAIIDTLFLAALTLLVMAGFVVVYSYL
jgi:hypothetical protein